MGAWILIGVALYVLITLAGYLDRRDVRREEQQRLLGMGSSPPVPMASASEAHPAPYGQGVKLILAWALVGLPLLWGVLQTLDNGLKLFK
jgi:hypothetical protein